MKENDKMAITQKGLLLLLAGLILMLVGYAFMVGGGSDDPQVFNYSMFNFRRLVLAPVVIVAGIIVIIVGIMGRFGRKQRED